MTGLSCCYEYMKKYINIIVFYLPQFHVIKENEAIYGKNFTEWNNVIHARKLYDWHYQPHIPHKDFGYYNLLDEDFIIKQHNIAYNYGINCFCYYYYNMSGRPLLFEPLHIINKNNIIKNRFCLCWAHHSWYYNRDNKYNIFIKQDYRINNIEYIVSDISKYILNKRYIKIDGKPLFIIFSPEKIPNAQEYIDAFRYYIKKTFIKEILIAGVEAFADVEPSALGLDFMIEFAPNWVNDALLSPSGTYPRIYDYNKTVNFMIHKDIPNYIRLRCAFPGWDNTPRRGNDGIIFRGANTKTFKLHLEYLKEYTSLLQPKGYNYIFINAWNEWGESCHLEPDMQNGYAYLKAVQSVFTLHSF